MKTERSTKDVMSELIEKADVEAFFVTSRSGKYGIHPRNEEDRNRVYAEEVGKLVLGLPESDRELLKGMSSEDILSYWFVGGLRFRPETESKRKRGPVRLKK